MPAGARADHPAPEPNPGRDRNGSSVPAAVGRGSSHPEPQIRWDGEPVPLSARRLLPPFPLDVLPGWAGDMAAAVSEFLQTPPDLAGCLTLAALSTAAGGRAVVEVRPGWREPVNLYVVVALPPGERKSPAFKLLTAPILDAEQALIASAAPRIDEAELQLRVAKARAERTARAAESALTPDAEAPASPRPPAPPPSCASSRSLSCRAWSPTTSPSRPPRPCWPSKAGGSPSCPPRAASSPPWPGATPAPRTWRSSLKGHSGDLLRVDRKGRPPEHVTAPALTLGLAVQPQILTSIAGMPGFRGRGLLARILYAMPTSTLGRRRIGTPPPPDGVADAYADNLRALILTLTDWTDPAVLPLTADAAGAVLQFEAELEPQLAPGAALAHVTDWAGKLTGTVTRLAGLLHLATHLDAGPQRPIARAHVEDAARLGRYYLAHALAVFDLMGADPLLDDAQHLLDWIVRRQASEFTRREAYAPNRARFAKPTDLDPALALLVEHGWIQPIEPPPRPSTGGRPSSPRYTVHPAAART